ncbi:MAG TPA: hypothetical protein VMR98_01420, partial [Candidatus Polarisedimenticolaceae bacterium]|nr:hypothetical protein [Candidatus Polarisedimenticolaceae bacterium]
MNSMIVFLVLVLAVGLLILMVISQSKPGSKRRKTSSTRVGGIDREFVARKWEILEQLSKTGGSGLRDAVSEADKLLDYALKHSGVSGDTMGARLKHSGQRFDDIDAIWRAHKLRNALAHE